MGVLSASHLIQIFDSESNQSQENYYWNKRMSAKEITLNIAVNLGRLCRWAMEGRRSRVDQFLTETNEYLKALESAPKSSRFLPTYDWFKEDFNILSQNVRMDEDWAESMLTWANILTHRASLA